MTILLADDFSGSGVIEGRTIPTNTLGMHHWMCSGSTSFASATVSGGAAHMWLAGTTGLLMTTVYPGASFSRTASGGIYGPGTLTGGTPVPLAALGSYVATLSVVVTNPTYVLGHGVFVSLDLTGDTGSHTLSVSSFATGTVSPLKASVIMSPGSGNIHYYDKPIYLGTTVGDVIDFALVFDGVDTYTTYMNGVLLGTIAGYPPPFDHLKSINIGISASGAYDSGFDVTGFSIAPPVPVTTPAFWEDFFLSYETP
jgi:hypothetical protein